MHSRHDFIADLNISVARLGCHNLIDTLSGCIRKANDVATFGEFQRVAAVFVGCDAFCREACVGSHILTNNGTSKCDRADAFGLEGVVEACFRVEIIEHIELCINILHREFGVDWVATAPRSYGCQVILINNNVRSDACGLFADSYDEGACVLWPDSTPIAAAHEVFPRSATVLVKVDGIVGDEHDGCSFAYCRQQFILDLNDTFVCLAIEVNDSEVEVRLDEIVVCDAFDKFPVTHWQDVISVANVSELQMAALVYVEEEVTHVVATIRGHIVINELRTLRFHISISEDELRTFRLVRAHSEETGLSQLTFLADAVVVLLLVCEFEGINCAVSVNADRLNPFELHEVSLLCANEEVCSGRNRNVVHHAHRHLSLYCRIEGHSSRVVGSNVTLCLTGFGGNNIEVVGVAAEHKEHLVAACVLAHRGVHRFAFLSGNLEVEAVVGAIDPIGVLHAHLGRVDSEGGVLGIDVELDGAAHRFAVGSSCCQEVRAGSSIEGVLVACRLAHTHTFIGRLVDQRLDELTLCIHCHSHFCGKGIARYEQCQHNET